ncbi:hypothetical protein BHE74_00044295 [Ensete ventricosum]|nr:hypothetical protein BHE74_00044295 [Ensete ventricosum]
MVTGINQLVTDVPDADVCLVYTRVNKLFGAGCELMKGWRWNRRGVSTVPPAEHKVGWLFPFRSTHSTTCNIIKAWECTPTASFPTTNAASGAAMTTIPTISKPTTGSTQCRLTTSRSSRGVSVACNSIIVCKFASYTPKVNAAGSYCRYTD